ncbi:MAG: dienelactone hydrolase family protein [Phycisphaerae bacterium]|nr:dienelactone hydrolase family protein [Phycisphaerae bacterium]
MRTQLLSVLLVATLVALLTAAARAEVKLVEVEYQIPGSDQVFRGFKAYDDAAKDKRPGVLVCHEWWGCNQYASDRAKQLASEGYVAFALDMYGKGNVTTDPKQAGEWAGRLYSDPDALRVRAAAGLKVLANDALVDPARLAAIGYCMGGTVALELARTGADLKAVVCFHTSTITAKAPDDNARIKAKVLICHGADDTFVKPGEIDTFHEQMRAAKVDYQFIAYAGAVHSFTSPSADKAGIPGVRYQAAADRRSWAHMRMWFREAFADAAGK